MPREPLDRRNAGARVGQVTVTDSFGARDQAPEAVYVADPDGNIIEARYHA